MADGRVGQVDVFCPMTGEASKRRGRMKESMMSLAFCASLWRSL